MVKKTGYREKTYEKSIFKKRGAVLALASSYGGLELHQPLRWQVSGSESGKNEFLVFEGCCSGNSI